jgi:hypothetical protein
MKIQFTIHLLNISRPLCLQIHVLEACCRALNYRQPNVISGHPCEALPHSTSYTTQSTIDLSRPAWVSRYR